ncbi:GtrA family protein [Streptomyces triculaminicus]|uniref:GtrA family protein n=1 Tax=Streptomyces triculaminicus TaxID=2816232 RepID=A0A939FUJ6_9ACTN|nr:GtrA family protein [Streptomyces triculaminicus]
MGAGATGARATRAEAEAGGAEAEAAEAGEAESAEGLRPAVAARRRPAPLASLGTASPLARMLVFGLIGLTGFLPNLLGLTLLTAAGLHYLPAEIAANQAGVLWNFLLTEAVLFRDRRAHRSRADRLARVAVLANADLLLRIPLIALLVGGLGLGVLPATALALLTTFVLRYAATEALVYLPRPRRSRGGGRHRHDGHDRDRPRRDGRDK